MKIGEILQNQQLPGQKKTSGVGSGVDFAAILQSRLAGTQSVGESQPSSSVQSVAASVPMQTRLDGLELSENAIKHLDSFSVALADQRLSAQQLEPYITALASQAEAMASLSKEIPAEHPLNSLLEQVAAVSRLEVEKYYRGDYN